MSELIDNRKHRQEILKEIIRDIHAGANVEDVKGRFAELLSQVGAAEISAIEQALIDEGLPIEEVQALCSIHVQVFREGLEKQREAGETASEETHPVTWFKDENKMITALVDSIKDVVSRISEKPAGTDISAELSEWRKKHTELGILDAHYARKENILFPYLEKNGITGPPSVMWGVDDEIRAAVKEINKIIQEADNTANPSLNRAIADQVIPTLHEISEMVYKEENILFPMCLETLTEDEWKEIGEQLKDPEMARYQMQSQGDEVGGTADGLINLDVGTISVEQINLLLTHLPIDVTFVDENDEVRYFSLGKERIFERTPNVIGRKVQNCHPPQSMHVVNQIINDFRTGKRDRADFWIQRGGNFILIQYFAVRDKEGQYRGTLEVTQNAAWVRSLEGEKRIYDEE
ncbi:MAG: DUF438 domain-containing protein [Firmicutes bacterium]|nr:DUF438 domain-containing protein [Bacillota bacterium]